ncbi:hypothetical protein [Psychrobacter sp. 72-O-c]|uniref:hypothetical protein n=1 Tax=Psychrobacter sp. 72-O-c TaxID=2774125 RepID=UPI00191A5F21|nr:hypothetical protein [Psychrobacter sp. 72-O-c]
MPKSTTMTSDWTYLTNELACYLQKEALEVVLLLPAMDTIEVNHAAKYCARQYNYLLPLGQLRLLEATLYLPSSIYPADIEEVRTAAITSALAWQKSCLSQNEDDQTDCYYVLILDIQLNNDDIDVNGNNVDSSHHQGVVSQRLTHHFGTRYFKESLVLDANDSVQQLQIFSWQDWHSILITVQTASELWRFLGYQLKHLKPQQLEPPTASHSSNFDSEQALLTQFMNSDFLFTQAIMIDDALIKYGMQDKPNSALVTMKLAQKNNSTAVQMYHQHMQQASTLWSQLSTQMIGLVGEKPTTSDEEQSTASQYSHWQQQLRDESLFSRHELVRTLYRHPKQTAELQQSGYVVHQHSYESLGRHYVLIFYGQTANGKQSKEAIQPNLQQIAQDVATRLPIAELHHVIVMGIEFIADTTDTFMDIDLWIQPVSAMTQKERRLTKQLQRLKHQQTGERQKSNQQDLQSVSKVTSSTQITGST